ncbi:MAG TPA: MoaD/ThiS family protein [Gemmatimonadaceae bacterium]|jgi:molybdopterin converting factor small subunit|nr:MoaD/ThiS family protein [Gemmatimonadaceae bacterium]
MTVTVLLFAAFADAFGRSSIEVTVDQGATVGDIVDQLSALAPSDRLPPRPLAAVNAEYAGYDVRLNPGDELALIPPVAGG